MKVTIITVTYNSAKTLPDAMRSVLSQTYKDIEYIVVDGKSKDGSVDIIRSFEPLFGGRLHWISEKDEGIYDAMNRGAERASGEILAWLNADDHYLPGTLEKVGAYFAEHPETELLHGNLQVNGRIFRPPAGIASFGGFRVFHPTVFVRREVFEKYGPFDLSYPICADLNFFLKAGRNGVRFVHLDEPLTDFALGGVSTARRKATAQEVRRILRANGYGGVFSAFWYAAMRARALAAAVLK